MRQSVPRRCGKELLLTSGLAVAKENFLARNGDRSALLEHGDELILHLRRGEFSLDDRGKLLRKTGVCRFELLVAQGRVRRQRERGDDQRKGSKRGVDAPGNLTYSVERGAPRVGPVA